MTYEEKLPAESKHATTNGSRERGSRQWIGYVVAIIGTFLAAVLRWVLVGALGVFPPYVTYFPIVVLVAMQAGRAAVLATLLSAAVEGYLLTPPHQLLSFVHVLHTVLFIISGLLVSLMARAAGPGQKASVCK